MEFPTFKYHPDPLGTCAVEATDEKCECCHKSRGYKAVKFIYAEEEIESICPWCIADGSAAERFDGEFSDSHPLASEGISNEIISEVCKRTPSFNSWQQETWLSHCNDACIFLGEADAADLKALEGAVLKEFLEDTFMNEDEWLDLCKNYRKGSGFTIYKFQCRHCQSNKFYTDCD